MRGESVWLFDAAGRRYLDVFNHFAHVGHANPGVLDALGQSRGRLHITMEYGNDEVARCAHRLVASFDDPLKAVHFCSSGNEAIDFALQIACRNTNARGVIVGRFSCHINRSIWLPTEMRTFTFPASTALPHEDASEIETRFRAEMELQLHALEASGFGIGALLLDPFLTFEGLPPVPAELVRIAIETVRRAGGLYIADETHSGLGRTGRRFWGYERYGIVPDIVTVGEPVANGIPMGAVITSAEIASRAGCGATRAHPSGGNPLTCAVACATLDALNRDSLCERALSVGEYLRHRMDELADERPFLGRVRGEGYYLGIPVLGDRAGYAPAKIVERIINQLACKGVLISGTGPDNSVLQIRPPMPFALEHADLLADALSNVVRELGVR